MDERIKVVGITVPSFQMMTGHAQKATNSEQEITNGMVNLEIEDAKITDVHWYTKTRSLPARENL